MTAVVDFARYIYFVVQNKWEVIKSGRVGKFLKMNKASGCQKWMDGNWSKFVQIGVHTKTTI